MSLLESYIKAINKTVSRQRSKVRCVLSVHADWLIVLVTHSVATRYLVRDIESSAGGTTGI